MLAIVTLLVVLLLSFTTVRIATIALTLTGISPNLARFQARSAFTGCGFTTNESEALVNHPVRRRILMYLMVLGPAGIVTTVGAVVAGVLGNDADGWGWWQRALLLVLGLVALWFVSKSKVVDRVLDRWVRWALSKYTDVDARDYAKVLHISGEYGLGEMLVNDDDWVAGKSLIELGLNREGVLVLGAERPGVGYVGAPAKDFVIRAGDTLLLYASSRSLADLDKRRRGVTGALRHADAVAEHTARSREETDTARAVAEVREKIEQVKEDAPTPVLGTRDP